MDVNTAESPELVEAFLLEYRQPWWLKTKYGARQFEADFGSGFTLSLDFDVLLPDGTSLASPGKSHLREEIYDYLCLQAVFPISRRGRPRRPRSEQQNLVLALHIVDYFLIRAEELQIHVHGFK